MIFIKIVLQVCKGDTIVVDAKNKLSSDSTTIHFHGIHQRGTPYMDGVPHVTQCPISPGSTFRYTFNAANSGTHFWHSHSGMQRGDGCFGALIIREPLLLDPHVRQFDFDMTDHLMIVHDWAHMPGTAMFTAHHHSIGDNKPPNILINGRGRYFGNATTRVSLAKSVSPSASTFAPIFSTVTTVTASVVSNVEVIQNTIRPNIRRQNDDATATASSQDQDDLTTTFSEYDEDIYYSTEKYPKSGPIIKTIRRHKREISEPTPESVRMPYEVFNVARGSRYRFRTINAEFLNCPIEISVDNHNLTVIASDGFNIEPIEVGSLVTYAGERFDFVINANQLISNYWIRLRGLMDCDQRFTSAYQVN